MSTTDILLNSHALNSLKRAQLVQICKQHGIKASGKNPELIAKLQELGRNLPPETTQCHPIHNPSLLDVSLGSIDRPHSTENMEVDSQMRPRPSDQWEADQEKTLAELKDLEEQYKGSVRGKSSLSSKGTTSTARSGSVRRLVTKMPGEFGAETSTSTLTKCK